FGNTTSTAGFLLRLSNDTARFEIRDSGNSTRFRIQNGAITVGSVPTARLTGTIANGNLPNDIVRTSRTITAGNGLSGGGNLSSNRTLSVDSSVVRTSGNQTIGGTKTFSSPVVGQTPTANNHLATKAYVDANAGTSYTGGSGINISGTTISADNTVLRTSGNQTKTGNLYFNGATRYIGTTDDNHFILRTNATNRLTIRNNGNVGIGTTSPTQRLDVSGNIRATGSITAQGASGFNNIVNISGGGSAVWSVTTSTNASNNAAFVGWRNLPTNGQRLAMFSGKGWGIGGDSSTPGAGMNVLATQTQSNTARGSELRFTTIANNTETPIDRLTIRNNGNVGIGTTTPSERLDVNGKIIMRSQTTSSDSNNTVATKGYVDSIAGGSGLNCNNSSNSAYTQGGISLSCSADRELIGYWCTGNVMSVRQTGIRTATCSTSGQGSDSWGNVTLNIRCCR
ncbi:hypothetical protein LAT59_04695, partial [Candidatus Gracilibacteria bacterium]|nr:hypothetical protein [Candidatus Gracilibacteria bacterium]